MIIFYYSLLFLSLSKEDMFNNPKKIELESNPIDYIIIIDEPSISSINNIVNYYDSYLPSQSLLLCIDESDTKFLLLENRLFSFRGEGEHYSFTYVKNIYSDVKYTGYITFNQFTLEDGVNLCEIEENEILLYGKKENNIDFYFIKEGNNYPINVDDIDENISCKLFYKALFICVFSQDGQVTIKLLSHRCSNNEQVLTKVITQNISEFSNHDMAILYDFTNYKYKLVCAREKDSDIINCVSLTIDISSGSTDIFISPYIIDIEQLSFSFYRDNCNYNKLEDEYLLCCGNTDIIKCEKRNIDFQLKNYFYIDLEGKITNLTIESDTDNLEKIIFHNSEITDAGIYEYIVYNPDCEIINIEIDIFHTFHTKTINMNGIFQRISGVACYISFNNLPSDYGTIKINDEIVKKNIPIQLQNDNNSLSFISEKLKTIDNYDILYDLYIDEKYRTTCQIKLKINLVVKGCNNNNEEYCTKCSEPVPFLYKGKCYSNCKEGTFQMQNSMNNEKICEDCYENCKTCSSKGTPIWNVILVLKIK